MTTEKQQTIELTNYSRKGIHAYLCPVSIKDGRIDRGAFISATPLNADPDNQRRFYAGKSARGKVSIVGLTGLYEFKEASGHKTSFGYLQLENGVIVNQWRDRERFLEAMEAEAVGEQELPDLIGSPKQVAWAEDIRRKVILKLKSVEDADYIHTESAKWWIDEREALLK